MPRPELVVGLTALALALSGCSAGAEDVALREGTTTVEPSAQTDSAGTTATVPPSCEDVEGDSSGGLDLTSVTVFRSPKEVLFEYLYTGDLPASGSLLFVASDGSTQYGYKVVDGDESSHFVFDLANAKQVDIDEDAEVDPGEARVAFPTDVVDVAELAGGTATISIDGQDVDECRLE